MGTLTPYFYVLVMHSKALLYFVNVLIKAAHVLVQPSSTASLAQNPQVTVRPVSS